MAQDVAHRRGGYVGEFLRSRDDDGFNLRGKAPVGIGNAALVFKVEHVAHATHDMPHPQFAADVDGESVIVDNSYTADPFCRLTDDIQFLLCGEKTALVLIDTDGHHDFIEHRECTLEDIEMSLCKRVERPGE